MFFRHGTHRPRLAESGAVETFVASLDHLDEGQLLALDAAWRGGGEAEHEAAWQAVREAAAGDGLGDEIKEVAAQVRHWAERGDNRPPLYHIANDDIAWAKVRAAAAPALVDAALAIAMGDRIDAETRSTLLGPWVGVTQATDR